MPSNQFGLSAVCVSATVAAASVALPSAVAQSPSLLTPKQASLVGVRVAPMAAEYEVSNLIVKFRAPTEAMARTMAAGSMRAMSAGAGVNMKSMSELSAGASLVSLEAPLPLSAAREVAARIAADPSVEFAEPDVVLKPAALPNDTEFTPKQWNWLAPTASFTGAVTVPVNQPPEDPLTAPAAGAINMAAAWDLPVGTNEVVIAIIDTGIVNHPDLNGNMTLGNVAYVSSAAGGRWLAGYDFVSNNALAPLAAGFVENADGNVGRDANPTDPGDAVDANTKNTQAVCYENKRTANNFATPNTWHGTRTAGIIAATADNNSGMAGIATKANIKILPVRALGRCGGAASDIADAITWASGGAVTGVPANATPAKVINVGAAGAPGVACPQMLQAAIDGAISRGAVVVAPTGNNYSLEIGAPANCNGVIGVTAHAINGETTEYTNIGPESKQGPNPVVSAPGGGRPASFGFGADAIDNPRWAGFTLWSTARRNVAADPLVVAANNPDLNAANGNNAYMFSGTSDAAAQVSAVAALILAKRSNTTPNAVLEIIRTSARPFPSLASCAPGNKWANQCGSGMLDALRALQATEPPVVVTQPRGVTVTPGQTATFTVEATGVTTYQWTRNGADIANTNAATYTTPELAAGDNNVAYAVKLINYSGTTTSAAATVTVSSPPSANAPSSGGGALPSWQLLLLVSLLFAARVRFAQREH